MMMTSCTTGDVFGNGDVFGHVGGDNCGIQ